MFRTLQFKSEEMISYNNATDTSQVNQWYEIELICPDKKLQLYCAY